MPPSTSGRSAALLEAAGATPADRLTDADAAGLPLPREVW